jgi:hypothetical protein
MNVRFQESEAPASEVEEPIKSSGDRTALFVAAGVLAACDGLVLYGVLDRGEDDAKPTWLGDGTRACRGWW